MQIQTYRVWTTDNKSVKVNQLQLNRLIETGKAVTIKAIGLKQPIERVRGSRLCWRICVQ